MKALLPMFMLAFPVVHLAAAPILYSNLAPGGSAGFYTGSVSPFGAQFIATETGQLASLRMPVYFGEPGVHAPVSASLYSGTASQYVLLESWSFNIPVITSPDDVFTNTTTIFSALNPTLIAGETYWLMVEGSPTVLWFANNTGVLGGYWYPLNGVFTPLGGPPPFPQPGPGIEVTGLTPVPEPATAAAVGLGLMAGVMARRRRHRA